MERLLKEKEEQLNILENWRKQNQKLAEAAQAADSRNSFRSLDQPALSNRSNNRSRLQQEVLLKNLLDKVQLIRAEAEPVDHVDERDYPRDELSSNRNQGREEWAESQNERMVALRGQPLNQDLDVVAHGAATEYKQSNRWPAIETSSSNPRPDYKAQSSRHHYQA